MLNLIVALSNLYCVYPALAYYQRKEYFSCLIIILSGLSSFIYHLIENIKHNMPGVGILTERQYQYMLLNLDRIFAIMAVGITGYSLIYKNVNIVKLIPYVIIALT